MFCPGSDHLHSCRPVLVGHSSNPKRRRDTRRIPHTRTGRRYRPDSTPPRWQPEQYWNQLLHNSSYRPAHTGRPGSVHPGCLVGRRFGVRQHRACRASRQHHVRAYKQRGSGVAGFDGGADGTDRHWGNTRGPADHEQPAAREPEPGRQQQAVYGDCEQHQPRDLRANHFLLFFQRLPAPGDHRRHRRSHAGHSCVCGGGRPLFHG